MPTNDFKAIAGGGGANVISQADFIALTTFLANGYSSGIVDSDQFNKVIRQSSAIANAVAQYLVDLSGDSALDDGDAATLLASLKKAVAAQIDLQSGNYCLDTGVANAYVIALSPPITAYTDGLTVRFRALNANTAASTLNAGGGVVALRNNADGALVSGDIPAGTMVTAVYVLALNRFQITSIVASQEAPRVPRRQTILQGAAAIVQIGSGLSCNLLAATTPVKISVPGGLNANGAIDYVASYSSDQAAFWSGLTNNATNYLFIDRNTSTGVYTGVISSLPYLALPSSTAPSIVSGQQTYHYDTGTMYVGNGATATVVQRTAVGECVTSGGAVTSVITYAPMGFADAIDGASPSNTRISFNHNLGCPPRFWRVALKMQATNAGYATGDLVDASGISNSSGAPVLTTSADRQTVGVVANTSNIYAFSKTGGTLTALNTGDVDTYMSADRGF